MAKNKRPPVEPGLTEELNDTVGRMTSANTMVEMASHGIWGAAVTTTRAFGKVVLKIDPNTRRIFVSIQLRWFAKWSRAEIMRKIWLAKCERRCQEHIPEGWKLLVYYEGGKG